MERISSRFIPSFDRPPKVVKSVFKGEIGRFFVVNTWRAYFGATTASTIGLSAATGMLPIVGWVVLGLNRQRKYSQALEARPASDSSEARVEGVVSKLGLGKFAPCRIEGPFNEHQAVESKLELIRSAKYTIRWAQAFAGGPTLKRALDELGRQLKQKDALHVRFMFNGDCLQSGDAIRLRALADQYPKRFQYLICKPQIIVYPRVRRIEHHVKLMVVDEHRFQVGGTEDFAVKSHGDAGGEAESPLGSITGTHGIEDMDIRGDGQQMGELLAEQFDELWSKWHRIMNVPEDGGSFASLTDNAKDLQGPTMEAALHLYSPEHGSQNGWMAAVKSLLEAMKAGDTVWIGNMCFNGKPVIDLLAAAAKRGIKIKVVTNGRRGFNPRGNVMHGPLNRSHYAELGPNAKIYEYPKDERLYHKKVWVFCPKESTPSVLIGSANISWTSIACDDDIMMEVRSAELAQAVIESLQVDIAGASPVSTEKIKKYSRVWNRLEALVQMQLFENILV